MDLESSYAEAWFQDRWMILGHRLIPMTIGHGLLLTRIQNHWAPFSSRTSQPTRLDLVQGLYVCSRQWRAAAVEMQRAITGLRWRYWDWLLRICGASHELVALHGWDAYVNANTSTPRLWIKQDAASGKNRSPILTTVSAFAMHRLGATFQTVLDYPLRVVLWHMAAYADSLGTVQLFTGEDEQMMRQDNGQVDAEVQQPAGGMVAAT